MTKVDIIDKDGNVIFTMESPKILDETKVRELSRIAMANFPEADLITATITTEINYTRLSLEQDRKRRANVR